MGENVQSAITAACSIDYVELIKAVLQLIGSVAWPVALLTVILIFKTEIKAKIPSVSKVSILGGSLESQAVEAPSSKLNFEALKFEKHPLITANSLAEELKQEAQKLPEDEALKALILSLAVSRVELTLESIYSAIFGSQIQALKELASSGPISAEEAKNRYEAEIRPSFEVFSKVNFEAWSSFLLNQLLVTLENNSFAITGRGLDLLTYMRVKNRPENRPF